MHKEISKKSKLIITTVLLFIGLLWMLKFWDLSTSVFLEFPYGEDYVKVGGNLFYIANWPSLLLKIYPVSNVIDSAIEYNVESGFFYPLVIMVNAIGWGLKGLIVGSLILIWKPAGMSLSFSDLKEGLFLRDKVIKNVIIVWLILFLSFTFFGFSIATMQIIPLISVLVAIASKLAVISSPFILPLLFIFTVGLLIKRDRTKSLTTLQRVTLWVIIITSMLFTICPIPVYYLLFKLLRG
jgi:hypothetical protein